MFHAIMRRTSLVCMLAPLLLAISFTEGRAQTSASPTRPTLGVQIRNVSGDDAKQLNMREARGAIVVSVREHSAASEANIKPGDVIVNFDGHDIADAKTLQQLVGSSSTARDIKLVIQRAGSQESRIIRLKDAPAPSTAPPTGE